MKIIEALKELPLIEKKIQSKQEQIARYAAYWEPTPGPTLASHDEQKHQVDALLQGVYDLAKHQAEIKKRLAYTNSQIKVDIGGVTATISEWISLKESGLPHFINTINHLISSADRISRQAVQGTPQDAERGFKFNRCYDEKFLIERREKCQGILDSIPATLEIINATTELLEV